MVYVLRSLLLENNNGNKPQSFEPQAATMTEQVYQYVQGGEDIGIQPPQITDIVTLKAAQRGLQRVLADIPQRSFHGEYIYHDDNPGRLDRFNQMNSQILSAFTDSSIDLKPDRSFSSTMSTSSDRTYEWTSEAPCIGLTEYFFPEGQGQSNSQKIQKAIEICNLCKVKEECREAGRDEKEGVWAGEYKPNPELSNKLTQQLIQERTEQKRQKAS